jgi:hypothetical protein
MARQSGVIVENNWVRGVITEATGLNFPEHAATDADNVRFDPKGSVSRRRGIDLEGEAETISPAVSDGVIKEFVWNAVAQTGGYTFLVLQKGSIVHLFELEDGDNLSGSLSPTSIDLDDYKAGGAPAINNIPCSFTSGEGYLFIAHPYCEPLIVRWNALEEAFEAAEVTIRVRDFNGLDDTLNVTDNPTSLSTNHHYNLRNQGWDQMVRVGNVTNEAGTGGSLSPNSGTGSHNLQWDELP